MSKPSFPRRVGAAVPVTDSFEVTKGALWGDNNTRHWISIHPDGFADTIQGDTLARQQPLIWTPCVDTSRSSGSSWVCFKHECWMVLPEPPRESERSWLKMNVACQRNASNATGWHERAMLVAQN